MKIMKQSHLRRELIAAGADKYEAAELTAFATELGRLKTSGKPARPVIGRRFGIALSAGFALGGAIIAVLLVIAVQSALPTSLLFPVQRLTDNAAATVHPQYRATVMMKRAQQVNELVAKDAPDSEVLATLNDYTRQAKAYEDMPHASYAAFEFCETNLNQAASAASPDIRQAINSSLDSLRTS